MSSQYRVKTIHYLNGTKKYVAQKKGRLFWTDLYYGRRYDFASGAEAVIRDDIRVVEADRQSRTVVGVSYKEYEQ